MRSTFAASSADENRCERDGDELNSSQRDVIHINLLVIQNQPPGFTHAT
jgi:hypothetical protein